MSGITDKLDKIANKLESLGMIKDAMDIDILANTIEAMEKDAWDADKSPQWDILKNALMAVERESVDKSLAYLKQGQQHKEMLLRSYGDIADANKKYPAKNYAYSYDQAIAAIQQNNFLKAKNELYNAMGALEALEPIINEGYRKGMPSTPGAKPAIQAPTMTQAPAQPSGDMVFSKKPPTKKPFGLFGLRAAALKYNKT